jgi:hypothetical protein
MEIAAEGGVSVRKFAGIAQLVEQLICNQQVVGSNPSAGSLDSAGKFAWTSSSATKPPLARLAQVVITGIAS